MTRAELVKIIDSCVEYNYSIHGEQEIFHTEELADRILSAFDKEREGEVLLCEGLWEDVLFNLYNSNPSKEPKGRKGQLIFRPTKEKI